MVIQAAELYRYKLRIQNEYDVLGTASRVPTDGSFREGFLIHFLSSCGLHGWGDVAPWPGRSQETLQSLQPHLVDRLSELESQVVPENWIALCRSGCAEDLPSSARYGIELAIADMAAQLEGKSIARWIRPHARNSVLVNALLVGKLDTVLDVATARMKDGYKAFKLKIGTPGTDDLELVRRVRNVIGEHAELRLDANRSLSFDDAIRFLRRIEDQRIEYIEEPLADCSALEELSQSSKVPIAVDESISDPYGAALKAEKFSFARAAILKPSLVGGLTGSMKLAEAFAGIGVEPVFTSLFESHVGVYGVAELAAAAACTDTAAGLDTLRYFASSVLTEPPPAGPVFALREPTKAHSVDRSCITLVT